MTAVIKCISYYLPPGVLSNNDLSREFPEWSVDKIARKTGIVERRIADANTCSSDLGVESARALFAEHGVDKSSIDFLLFCTQSPDYFLPTTACLLQERLGIPEAAGALDFNLGCSGFVYGLSLARGLVESGDARNVLLITAETYSKFIDPADKSVRTIFGDGAAATLVCFSDDQEAGLGPFVFGTDGAGGRNLIVPTGGLRRDETAGANLYVDHAEFDRKPGSLFMNGTEVFQFTLRRIPKLVADVLTKANLREEQIDLYVFHQANEYMLEALRKKLNIDTERFFVHIATCANTVSSTIPIALAEAIKTGRVGAGSRVMLVGFGVGYSWAGCIARLQ